MSKKKLSRLDLQEMKNSGQTVVWITAYDYWTAHFAEQSGMDMLLVGDSLGMCIYGYAGTVPVTMDQCIYHSEAVRRGAPNTFVIGDMPFLSYQVSVENAVLNAGRFHKEASVDAVKLEGGMRVCPQIKAIADGGMLVVGDDIFCSLFIGHGTRPGDPEDAAGQGALLAPEANAELDAEITFLVAPGVDAVSAGERVGAGDEGEVGAGAYAADADLLGVGVDAHEGVGEVDDEVAVDGLTGVGAGVDGNGVTRDVAGFAVFEDGDVGGGGRFGRVLSRFAS